LFIDTHTLRDVVLSKFKLRLSCIFFLLHFYAFFDYLFVCPYYRNKIAFSHIPLSSQYTFVKKANFSLSTLPLFVFIVSTTLLAACFGGRTIYKWIWSFLFLFLSIPIQGNTSLSLEILFLCSLLPFLRASPFGIGLSKQYDIEFCILYGLISLVSYFHYIKERAEDIGNCSHPHSYRWGVPAILN